LKELELYEIYSSCHPSCHQLQSEHVEVEATNMPEVKDMYMIEEQMNHQLREEGMNMVDRNIVEVDSMDTIEKHFHSMNHGLKVEGIDTVNTGMKEYKTTELKVVERELEDNDVNEALDQRWSGKLVRSGRSLPNQDIQKINPHL
jgi:hypothetical protein